MYKLKFIFPILISFAFIFAPIAKATGNNLSVVCQSANGPCSMSPNSGDPLFYETNMLPGDSAEQTLSVSNQDKETACNLLMEVTKFTSDPSTFAGRLFTSLQKNGADIFGTRASGQALPGYTIQNVYDTGLIDSGVISANSTANYNWLTTFDSLAGNEFKNAKTVFDFDINFSCEGEERAFLDLSKDNDTGGTTQHHGSTVTYTLTLTAHQDLEDVQVYDLPPEGFDYVIGSWTGTGTEPTYHSPGTWQVGNMTTGQTITLTYKTTINNSVDPGTYPDLAWAKGDFEEQTVYANDPTYFVGTEVAVDTSQESSVAFQGEVLGASTELPATGANSVWLILAAVLTIIGLTSISYGIKSKHKNA